MKVCPCPIQFVGPDRWWDHWMATVKFHLSLVFRRLQ